MRINNWVQPVTYINNNNHEQEYGNIFKQIHKQELSQLSQQTKPDWLCTIRKYLRLVNTYELKV